MALLLLAASYLLGAVPFGLLVVRALSGRDITREGSGNIGASNVFRVAGPVPGVLALLLDLAKGVLPVVVAQCLGLAPAWQITAGIAAIAGHNWSIFLRGRGGRGVASSFGVLLALSPPAGVLGAAVWIVVVAATRYASLASLCGVTSVPIVMLLRREPLEHVLFGLAALVMVVYQHRGNIHRLVRGQELRITHRPKQ